jgi:hypothetical protein
MLKMFREAEREAGGFAERAPDSALLPRRRPLHHVAAVAEPPAHRARGVLAGVLGMTMAVVGTLIAPEIVDWCSSRSPSSPASRSGFRSCC